MPLRIGIGCSTHESARGTWMDCDRGNGGGGNKADRDYSKSREGGGGSGRDSSGRGSGDKGGGRADLNPDGYGYGTGSNQEDFYPSTWGQAVFYATDFRWLGLMPNYIPTGFPPRFTQAIINIRAEYLRAKAEAVTSAAAAVAAAKAEAEYKAKVVAESELLKDESLLSPDMRTSVGNDFIDVNNVQKKVNELQHQLDHITGPRIVKRALQDHIKGQLSPEINKLNAAIEKLKPIYEQARKEKETAEKAAQDVRDAEAKADAEKASNEVQKEQARKDHDNAAIKKLYENIAMEKTIKDAIAEFKDKNTEIYFNYGIGIMLDKGEDYAVTKTSAFLLMKTPWPLTKALGAGIWAVEQIKQCNMNENIEIKRQDAIAKLEQDQQTFYNTLTQEQLELYPHLVKEIHHE